MITMAQLRAFAAVAKYKHFTRAAESLYVAQPTVSYHVRALERQLRIQLLEVAGHRVYLTAAGERLAERANAVLNEIESIEQELHDYSTGLRGRLRLGATRTVGGYALPAVLGAFCTQHPGIDVRLTINNTKAIEQLLLDRSLDIAVVEWTVTSPGLLRTPLRRDDLVLVSSPDHPLCLRSGLTLDDLRHQAFIMRESGSGTRALAEQILGPIANDIIIANELDQPEAILRMVEASMSLAFISRVIAEPHLLNGVLKEISVEGIGAHRDFSLVQLMDRKQAPAASQFARFLTDAWADGWNA